MLEDITKEELVIYNYVSDKLDNYINQNGKDNLDMNNNNYETFIKILFGVLVSGFLIFIWYNRGFIDNDKTIKQNDIKKECNENDKFCFRTL